MASNAEIPPAITTAHLLLRGLMPAFIGCPIGDNDCRGDNGSGVSGVRPSAFQMTYRKDSKPNQPKLTGKVTWNLGKQHGMESCALHLPREENKDEWKEEVEQFWIHLERAANHLISQSNSDPSSPSVVQLKRYEFESEDVALSSCGMVIMDAGQVSSREKKLKKLEKERKAKEAEMQAGEGGDAQQQQQQQQGQGESEMADEKAVVGCLILNKSPDKTDSTDGPTVEASELLAFSLLHGPSLLPSLSDLGSLKILRENPKQESNLVCNKKKCEITIKFLVEPRNANENGIAEAPTEPTSTVDAIKEGMLIRAMTKEIRIQEGLDYQLWRQTHQLKKMERDLKHSSLEGKEGESPTADAAEATGATEAAANASNGDANADHAAADAATTNQGDESDDMVVTAFEVSGHINYTKLIEKFGSKPITPYLLKRIENVTVKMGTVPKLHRFLRREIFFSHRDMEKICELLEGWYGLSPPPEDGGDEAGAAGEAGDTGEAANSPPCYSKPNTPCPFYLYTGRGPSSSAMHLGHLIPFLFTSWLQKAFQCPLVIQMTDDEKFLFKGSYDEATGDNLDHFANLTIENAKDIIACGFIQEKTFLFSDLEYVGRMYPNIVRIWKSVTVNQVNGIFGFDGGSNIGKVAFPAVQAAPSFGTSFPVVLGGNDNNGSPSTFDPANLACLIPCAIDQDPYFRLTRDIAHKLVPRDPPHPLNGKPALIHSKFFPPLQGAQGKMSSSDANASISAIFLTDSPQDIERKIKMYAFSGGQETKAMQMELGANLEVDVSYQWLKFFLEEDDELEKIGREYGTGRDEKNGELGEYWSTGKVKEKLVVVLKELVREHQERRETVTEEVVREWMKERCIL